MKEKLCRAFCDDLRVRDVPAGLAISTTFAATDGDRIGFYVIKDGLQFRIEDDGLVLPALEASGVDFKSGTRGAALDELLSEYGVRMDGTNHEFFMSGVTEDALPSAALKFVAFSLRVRDFMLMTEYRVATSFREDASKLIREVVRDRAILEENATISPSLSDFPADFVLRAVGRRPVGVYLGISDQRILEALFTQMRARHETRDDVSIVALVEQGRSISAKVRQQAMNRLDAVTEFRGDEVAAIERIAFEAIGDNRRVH
jgi:Domain of unknown function DUF1828